MYMNFQSKKSFVAFIRESLKDFFNYVNQIINTVLLSIVYILAVSFTWFIAKIFKKKFLDLAIDKNKKTYWEDFEQGDKLNTNYFRQF